MSKCRRCGEEAEWGYVTCEKCLKETGPMPYVGFFLLLLTMAGGCISPSYYQRKLREARGEPEVVKVVNHDSEYYNFMNHVQDKNPIIGEPIE